MNDTLEALRGQWLAPVSVSIIAADALTIPDYEILTAPAEPGEISRLLCATLNARAAGAADYVAVLNAGDTISPGCLPALRAGRRRGAGHALLR